jgi:hypothetical protein
VGQQKPHDHARAQHHRTPDHIVVGFCYNEARQTNSSTSATYPQKKEKTASMSWASKEHCIIFLFLHSEINQFQRVRRRVRCTSLKKQEASTRWASEAPSACQSSQITIAQQITF